MGLTIAQMWDAADGKLVDMSSDTLPGLPTQEQILEMRAKGTQPTREGGFGYLRGPDGAMIENAQAGTAERFNHVHMYHEHPNCAMNWYVTHLGAKIPPGRGSGPAAPAGGDCQTKTLRAADVAVVCQDRLRSRSGGRRADRRHLDLDPAVARRRPGEHARQDRRSLGAQHRGSTTAVARLKREGVKFLEEIHPWGNSRAAMIEGPDRIAIEMVEVK